MMRFSVLLSFLLLSSCAIPRQADIPLVHNYSVWKFVKDDAIAILKVSEFDQQPEIFKVELANLSPKGIAGMSVGNHTIYIDYEIARRAYEQPNSNYRPYLRMVLAHEIGHDMAGHVANQQAIGGLFSVASRAASVAPGFIGLAAGLVTALAGRASVELYTRSAELEADRKGIEYWKKLGWSCAFWVALLDAALKKGHRGDFHHPTEERLEQAKQICPLGQTPFTAFTPLYQMPVPEQCGDPETRRQFPILCGDRK